MSRGGVEVPYNLVLKVWDVVVKVSVLCVYNMYSVVAVAAAKIVGSIMIEQVSCNDVFQKLGSKSVAQ
jgi:hypothetical protein